jgi:hypothetical protein
MVLVFFPDNWLESSRNKLLASTEYFVWTSGESDRSKAGAMSRTTELFFPHM